MLIFEDDSSFQNLTFTNFKGEAGTKCTLTKGRAR